MSWSWRLVVMFFWQMNIRTAVDFPLGQKPKANQKRGNVIFCPTHKSTKAKALLSAGKTSTMTQTVLLMGCWFMVGGR